MGSLEEVEPGLEKVAHRYVILAFGKIKVLLSERQHACPVSGSDFVVKTAVYFRNTPEWLMCGSRFELRPLLCVLWLGRC